METELLNLANNEIQYWILSIVNDIRCVLISEVVLDTKDTYSTPESVLITECPYYRVSLLQSVFITECPDYTVS